MWKTDTSGVRQRTKVLVRNSCNSPVPVNMFIHSFICSTDITESLKCAKPQAKLRIRSCNRLNGKSTGLLSVGCFCLPLVGKLLKGSSNTSFKCNHMLAWSATTVLCTLGACHKCVLMPFSFTTTTLFCNLARKQRSAVIQTHHPTSSLPATQPRSQSSGLGNQMAGKILGLNCKLC